MQGWRKHDLPVEEGAPWHRVIEAGPHAMVLDTEAPKGPYFGALNGSTGINSQSQILPISGLF